MSRLIAKGIIRSYSMRQQRIGVAVKQPIGIISNCDVCGGLMFNQSLFKVEATPFQLPVYNSSICWIHWGGFIMVVLHICISDYPMNV